MPPHPQAQQIAPEVLYEWNMLRYCYERIRNEWQNAADWHRNLFLEGFLLHARVLRDFFVGKEEQDDVKASHFFDNPSNWNDNKTDYCNYLQQNRRRLDKYLAHLTYERINEDKNWDCQTIFNELNEAWESFYSSLPQEKQEWFNQ